MNGENREQHPGTAQRAIRWVAANRTTIQRSIAVLLLLTVGLAAIWLVSTYTYYAAIIDKQLANHMLNIPAGIYAAPRRISVGEQISRDEFIERVQRAGYQEGADASDGDVDATVDDASTQEADA